MAQNILLPQRKVGSGQGEGRGEGGNRTAAATAAATGGSSQMSIILARHAVADPNHPKGKVAQAGPQFGASVARTCKHVAHERSCR